MASHRARSLLAPALAVCLLLAACGSGDPIPLDGDGLLADGATVAPRTYRLCNAGTISRDALIAFFDAREGDTISFCAGRFDLPTGLILNGTRGITIRAPASTRPSCRSGTATAPRASTPPMPTAWSSRA